MTKAGSMLLEFAPVMQGLGTQPGDRRYEWSKKQAIVIPLDDLDCDYGVIL